MKKDESFRIYFHEENFYKRENNFAHFNYITFRDINSNSSVMNDFLWFYRFPSRKKTAPLNASFRSFYVSARLCCQLMVVLNLFLILRKLDAKARWCCTYRLACETCIILSWSSVAVYFYWGLFEWLSLRRSCGWKSKLGLQLPNM